MRGRLLTCPMSLPLPQMPALPALKMSLFILSLACPSPPRQAGGLIFARNFYRAERNSGVTCRTLACVEGRSVSQQAEQAEVWRAALLDTVALTGSHKSLVWAAHKGWGEYYCRSRVKLCCGPGRLGVRGAGRGRAGCGPITARDAPPVLR